MNNPFEVQTPELLTTSEMVALFVPEFSDYKQVEKAGHTILSGPRGAGKSMILRFMEPDCQVKNLKSDQKNLFDIEYYGAYVPIKDSAIDVPDLDRLSKLKHGETILNEHILVVEVGSRFIKSLKDRTEIGISGGTEKFWDSDNIPREYTLAVSRFGSDGINIAGSVTASNIIEQLLDEFEKSSIQASDYIKKIAFSKEILPFSGNLLGYSDFLLPLIKAFRKSPLLPRGPIFFLIDDADNLNESQTRILNSWVSRRTTKDVCFKIVAQEGAYKTHLTTNDQRIDSPHDYSDFLISEIYTTNYDTYKDRVEKIIDKRLLHYEIGNRATEFFPDDKEQENRIKEIANKLKAEWRAKKKRGVRPGGARPEDDAQRYARPDFMKSLSGPSKSSPSYSYAGFNQLVHISSGVVRHFLEAASRMHAEEQSIRKDAEIAVVFIKPSTQDKIIREYSEEFFVGRFDKISDKSKINDYKKLQNLINALGRMFRRKLLSDESERRVFSIAFSNGPDEEVKNILDLGVQIGYFHKSTIGNKEGTGRVPLYILSRRLAPYFKLDPTGFAGYQFVINSKIKEAMDNPRAEIREIKDSRQESLLQDE